MTVSVASPTLATTPGPNTLAAGVTLKDTAFLVGGFNPTGSITFTLVFNGSTQVDSETVTVNGNGAYTTPTGFATGMASGTYQWNAAYSGDTNNNIASDVNDPTEQVTVIAPPVTLSTTPIPATVTLGATPATLNDTADLEGGLDPTGTITFTLVAPGGGTVDTETATVNGDGIYRTPTGFTLLTTGTATGTYQWNAVYSGDANNSSVSDLNNTNEQVTVSVASPALATLSIPNTVTLGATPVTLNDVAQLANGFNPMGTITFTLVYNSTTVDTEMVAVNGNGTYTTPTGFTLPTTGTVTGTYQWNAVYSGDANNSSVSDNNATKEQVTVSAAHPTLSTNPSPTSVTLGTTSVTLKDTAVLQNGFNPTGTITFTLVAPGGGTVDTVAVSVNGNGIYTTPTGFTLPNTGSVTGTYQWNASYSGSVNNNAVSDNNDPNERVTVNAANPTLITTPNPTVVTLGTSSVILRDSATLEGGYSPTGRITFTLFRTGSPTALDTEIVTVNGNGIYTTPTGFTPPNTNSVTGTYQWNASYSGSVNNNAVSDNNDPNERVTVNAASPTLTTTPNPTAVLLGATTVTLTDAAVLSGGYHPTGRITFTLFYNGGATAVDTETITVNGNGTYKTPTGFTLPSSGSVTGTYQWNASYSADSNNNATSDNNDPNERVTVNAASPTLGTTPNPTAVTLGATAPPLLKDTATLAGGYHPTGTITFTLFHTGDTTAVDTETIPVNGNGTYTTPTGFTLPTTGTVTGTYQWDASYNGNTNNMAISDNNAANEQVTVSAASPTLTTTPNPPVVLLGGRLQDVAMLASGFAPTGSITFKLYAPGVDPTIGPATYTETVTNVNGNGTYQTTVGFVSNATGIWHWVASYSGDPNNNTKLSPPWLNP